MRILRASKLASIFPPEIRDVLKGGARWVRLLLGISAMAAMTEAAVLANMLFLGFIILGQQLSGPLSGIFNVEALSEYSQQALLVFLSITLIVLVSIRCVLTLAYRYVTLKWTSEVARQMHEKIMGGIISAPLHVFDQQQFGGMVHDSMNAPLGATAAIDASSSMLSAIFLICTFTLMLVLISPWLLIIAIAIAVIWFTTVVPQIRKRVQHEALQRYNFQSDGTKIASDTINGIREIRALSAETKWLTKFSHNVDKTEAARVRMSLVQAIAGPALNMLIQVGFASAIIFASVMLSSENLTSQLPILGTFAYALFRIYPVIGQISQGWITLSQTLPNLKAAAKWTQLPKDHLAGGTESVVGPIDSIRFDHVWFSYNQNESAISDVNFCIQPGKVTALVGASGVGKSTIIDLILKFRTPARGNLWLGYQNLTDVLRQSWLNRIGLVRQEVFLLSDSIRENLLQYRADATDEELRSACQQADALEFIDAMPEGLDTMVGERGVALSGGQRQRISIARALLRNSDVLVLDEAMSALDGETEARVLKSILANSGTRIILLISHRLATVRHADHIIMLDRGRVIEQGTHDQLLMKHEKYWDLFFTQMDHEESSVTDGSNL